MAISLVELNLHLVRSGKKMHWFEFNTKKEAYTVLNQLRMQLGHLVDAAFISSGNINKNKYGFGLTHWQYNQVSKHLSNPLIQNSIPETGENNGKSISRLVISIQSLDEENVTLENPDSEKLEMNHANLNQVGNGHSGLAIASTLNSPFVVLRSEDNQDQMLTTAGKIDNNSLIFITGHCGVGLGFLSGDYFSAKKEAMIKVQRSPEDIVRFLVKMGLKAGYNMTIVLCVCHGAQEEDHLGIPSFASKLANAFAEIGVDTNIFASKGTTVRFGKEAIVNGAITFSTSIGINPNDLVVFETKTGDRESKIETRKRELTGIIQITAEGLKIEYSDSVLSSNNSRLSFFTPAKASDLNSVPQSENSGQRTLLN
ncbi:hypothetical protein OQJ02_12720 [Legionella sp. PATHC032]|uniref:hypothetical protein n=1 Tax=Legionella sp. PATHC032 TaxID=2992039 RepID=UPI001B154844|nr:hypothetical protein [Legionella sp. PATHC032]MCW8422494.1 hypothetical protein [Legionella sp. PATHC032]HAZ7574178.1 hypothetical protein [Legionella pneumophila]HBA1636372.1 hypothetical protein [Legionella pneumophila]